MRQTIYNPLGFVAATIDAMGGITRYTYDPNGRLIKLRDPVGNETSWEYDKNGNVTKETDPLGNSTLFVYNAANLRTSRTDRLGRQIVFTYAGNNQLLTETWKNAAGTTVNTVTNTYNPNGQILTAGDNNGTITLTYDDFGNVATQTDVWGKVLTMTYDKDDRLKTLAESVGGTQEFTWDAASRLEMEKYSDASSQLREDFTYNARNQVTDIKRYTDLAGTTLESQTVFVPTDGGRTSSITHKNAAGTTLDSFGYTYDTAGRVKTETSTLGPAKTLTYDANSQLKGDGTNTYGWDANGNSTNTGFTTTTGNRLTTDGTWNYTYDAEGNEIGKWKTGEYWVYSYDNRNRLTHAEKRATENGAATLSVDFQYDVFGNRIAKIVDADGAGSGAAVTLKMAYDLNGNAWADLDNSGSLTTRRIFDGVDHLIARIGASTNEDWYLTDLLGSVRDIVNTSGMLIDHIDYNAFGLVTNESSPSNGDRYAFTGRERDTETGLLYYRAWYLDPNTMRWMEQDPIGFKAGKSKGTQLFFFAKCPHLTLERTLKRAASRMALPS